ncbi:hypothetical protein TB2_001785 [Malus domestica]
MREGINQRNVKVEGPGECGDSWKERKRLRLDFHESTFQRRNNGVVIRNRRANVSDSSVKCQKQEQSLPSNFHSKNLIDLEMPYSQIEQLWEGTKRLERLEFIDLSHSQYLNKTPDVTEAKKLEILNLEGCSSLTEVHPSVSDLTNLVFFSLKECKELQVLSRRIHMKSLKTLILSGCLNLDKFPEISGSMQELSELYIDQTAIEELPSSISILTEHSSIWTSSFKHHVEDVGV